MTRHQEAMAAYKEIMNRPLTEGERRYTPPPREMRDKKWSRELRSLWPNYTAVQVQDTRMHSEKSKWASECGAFYWYANNHTKWYFSSREAALLFKLSFGGEVTNECI